ncbi:MAG: carboxypeptidase-like regulatory domain-containing protein [Planctomycetota bacterium]|nr:carboxypeptidase-like regulatory domain-containing protein [Planctomycetota bacterium]
METSQAGVPALEPGESYELPPLKFPKHPKQLSGRLVDTAGAPIANAWVRADSNWNWEYVYHADPARSSDLEVQTDSNGEFTMHANHFGNSTIQVLVTDSVASNASEAGFDEPVRIQFFKFHRDLKTAQVFIFNPKEAGIKGSFASTNREPLEDVEVVCYRHNPDLDPHGAGCIVESLEPSPYLPEDQRDNHWYTRGRYDSGFPIRLEAKDGTFDLAGIPPGEWSFTFRAKGHLPKSYRKVQVPTPWPFAATLEPAGELRVKVLGLDGLPRPGAQVKLTSVETAPRSFTYETGYGIPVTGSDGTTVFEDIRPIRYRVDVSGDGHRVGCQGMVDVIPGEITEVVLRPVTLGEVLLLSPEPKSHLEIIPRLVSMETEKVHRFSGRRLNEHLLALDVVPGRYQLKFTFQEEGPTRLLEPVIEVRAGERTSIPIEIAPGFIFVKAQVRINQEPVAGGILNLTYADSEQAPGRLGGLSGIIADRMPERVFYASRGISQEVSNWSRPSEDMPWEIDIFGVNVGIDLKDPEGNLVHLPWQTKPRAYLQPVGGGTSLKGFRSDRRLYFGSVPPGQYSLKLARPTDEFPWVLSNDVEIDVIQGPLEIKRSVQIVNVTPVVGVVEFVDWPDFHDCWVSAWGDAECTHHLGSVFVDQDGTGEFEFLGPKPTPFWLSVESSRSGHNVKSEAFGPFELEGLQLGDIRLRAVLPE